MPSSLINLLAIRKLDLSSVLIHPSMRLRSSTAGTKSYPIPSTLYEIFCVFRLEGNASMEPCGSIPIILHEGIFSLNFLAIPQMAPPVPADINI